MTDQAAPEPPGSSGATDLVAPARRGRAALFAAVPVLLVLAVFVVILATREPSANRIASTPLLGKRAPAIEGTTLTGDEFSLDDLHGRWVVVNFFATWCVPCIQEHPELVSFQRRHAQVGDASVVSVVAGDEPDTVAAFFEKNGGDWPVLSIDTGRVALEYGMVKVPESYLVDPDGIVQAKIIGGVTSTGLDQLIGKLSGAGE